MTRTVEGVLTIIQGFKSGERGEFLRGLVERGVLSHDDRDVLTMESRRGGKTRPLGRFIADMRRKGRLR